MPIKLIAVDMDGTFLDDNKQYNKSRFFAQYQKLKTLGVHFVAASGNPLYTLKYYFDELQDEIGFVAENGALVSDGQNEIAFRHFQPQMVKSILASLLPNYEAAIILCGKNQGIISKNVPPQAIFRLQTYFRHLSHRDDLLLIDEPLCKITLNTDCCDASQVQQFLAQQPYVKQQQVKVVSSGFGFIDLIVPNLHKANGLSLLQQKWQVSDQQVLAIGDNHNDLEMIQAAGFGFAMANAVPAVKAVAKYQAKSNAEQGVLEVIDQFLLAQPPFRRD